MAHFAQVDDSGIVQQVIVVNNEVLLDEDGNESPELGVAFCQTLYGSDTNWIQTSYNNRIYKNYAGIGYRFDEVAQAFIPPQPGPEWTLNPDTFLWDPPDDLPPGGAVALPEASSS